MRKTKKTNWKILFSLVGFITLWSCQDDNISKNHNHSHDHNTKDLVFKNVNLSDIPNLKNSLNNLKSEISLSRINYRTIENQSNYFDLIVPYNINSFVYDKSNNLHHYTFALNIEETNTKTNLVAKETLSGEFEYYVFVFKPDDYQEWYNAMKNSDTSYNKSIDFEAFEIGEPQNTTYSMCLETTEVWTCPWGIHTLGEPGWGDCDSFKPGGGGINSWVRSYTYQMVSCGGLGGGGSTPVNPADPNNPSNPNPGGGSGNGAGAIPNLTEPDPCVINASTSFIDLLNDAQKTWWNNPQNSDERNQINAFLGENGCEQGDTDFAKEILDVIIDYKNQYSSYDYNLVNEFLQDVFNPEPEEEIEIVALAPSCESFNFTQTGTANWQESAVQNIYFRVLLVSPQGISVENIIDYPQSVLFGCPQSLANGIQISQGTAATLSARALKASMNYAVNKYGNKKATNLMVKICFESRLKYNYPLYLSGGRVNFNSNNTSLIPTQYQTNFFGTGDCD